MSEKKYTADTKEEVLRQADRLFGEKGFHNTSMSEIAEAVGIQKPSLYYFFDSKENIYFKVVDRIMEQTISLFHQASTEQPREDLAQIIEECLNKGLQAGFIMSDIRDLIKIDDSKRKTEIKRKFAEMKKEIADHLDKLSVSDPQFAAQVLIDCLQMYLLRQKCGERQMPVREFAANLANILCK